jgi:hypothetical protein
MNPTTGSNPDPLQLVVNDAALSLTYGDGRVLEERLGRVAAVNDHDERVQYGRYIGGHLTTYIQHVTVNPLTN